MSEPFAENEEEVTPVEEGEQESQEEQPDQGIPEPQEGTQETPTGPNEG